MNIAIVGATGNVGRKILEVLEKRNLPIDYIYFVADGVVAAEGSPKQLMASKLPFVKQFIHAEKDGPVPFHYNAPSIKEDLDL